MTSDGAPNGHHGLFSAPRGAVLGLGYVIPREIDVFTTGRLLVVADLIRRVLEDLHGAQVLAAVLTADAEILEWMGTYVSTVRPPSGVFASPEVAGEAFGRPLSLLIAPDCGAELEPWLLETAVVPVAPVHTVAPGLLDDQDPATLRYVLAQQPYGHDLVLTPAAVEHAGAELAVWRDRMREWSRWPSRPVPESWRARVLTALNDNLDITTVLAHMHEIAGDITAAAGAKFETFAFLDRILGVDLVRDLARTPSTPITRREVRR
ncbi:hypothetical protein ACIBQ0_10210 [Nocardia nova]|uniref:hypothetical protein n=1 Tax=Nocardia nova TaxID=37330 RepID=UPI0037AA3606